MADNEYQVEMRNMYKSFGGVKAVQNVSLAVKPGEIHALIGENGAGKSTLIRLLSGALIPDEGEVYFQGKKVNLSGPLDGIANGVSPFIKPGGSDAQATQTTTASMIRGSAITIRACFWRFIIAILLRFPACIIYHCRICGRDDPAPTTILPNKSDIVTVFFPFLWVFINICSYAPVFRLVANDMVVVRTLPKPGDIHLFNRLVFIITNDLTNCRGGVTDCAKTQSTLSFKLKKQI